jgi:hypothetical protein
MDLLSSKEREASPSSPSCHTMQHFTKGRVNVTRENLELGGSGKWVVGGILAGPKSEIHRMRWKSLIGLLKPCLACADQVGGAGSSANHSFPPPFSIPNSNQATSNPIQRDYPTTGPLSNHSQGPPFPRRFWRSCSKSFASTSMCFHSSPTRPGRSSLNKACAGQL